MRFNVKYKKIVASVMAFSIVASGAIVSGAGYSGKVFTPNAISASAAEIKVYGDWSYEVKADNTAKLLKYNGTDTEISIPQGFEGHSVSELATHLFKDNKTVKTVRIPRGISVIPDYCFYGATELEEVVMPLGITDIKQFAFYKTTSLKTIAFPISLSKIEVDAFGMSGLTEVTLLPNTVMGTYAFENCKNLKTVNLPEGLTKIYLGEFNGCTALESLTLPSTLKTIDTNAFRGCSSLETLEIPESVTKIGSGAFSDCTGIKELTLLNSSSDIHYIGTFSYCASLENVNLSNEDDFKELVTLRVFNNCENLRKVNGEDIVNYIKLGNSETYMPRVNSKYAKWVNENFDDIDACGIGFYEDMLRAKIKNIVASTITDDMTEGQKIKALHDWVCNKIVYAYDSKGNPDASYKSHVDSSIFMNDKSVCEGYARGLTLLYNEAGIEAYYVTGKNHAWCMVKLGDRYFHIDATHDDGSVVKYDHFLISDTDLQKCPYGHDYWGIVRSPRAGYTVPSETPECAYSVGDANMDGFINSDDADLINAYLSGEADLEDFTLADTDLDGEITENDAAVIGDDIVNF